MARLETSMPGPAGGGTECIDDAADHTDLTSEFRQRDQLKRILIGLDLVGLAASWTVAYYLMMLQPYTSAVDGVPLAALGLAGIIASLVVMASRRLWLARVCAVRSTHLASLGQMAVVSALVVLAAGQLTDYDAPDRFALLGAVLGFATVTTQRMLYEAWLRASRRCGRFVRRLVLLGVTDDSADLIDLINTNPESGYQLIGACGSPDQVAAYGRGLPWLGDYHDGPDAISRTSATGALVIGSAFEPAELNATLRHLLAEGCHVHLSSGLRGISHGRLLPLPLVREPLFYLESTLLTRSQLAIKRIMDVVIGGLITLVTLPVMVTAAIAIKLEDGGPVIFKQQRVGHHGKRFTVHKLRTMVTDAEAQRARLESQNHRSGPLFKMVSDPRITRVGRILRATSIDELPQLLNVLRGDMSLIGPRPALPEEVAAFDEALQERGRVMPGITGLWQVEARDDPSFDSYRRLDLYYVENWSIGLDLAILLSTVGVVIPRGLRMLFSTDVGLE